MQIKIKVSIGCIIACHQLENLRGHGVSNPLKPGSTFYRTSSSPTPTETLLHLLKKLTKRNDLITKDFGPHKRKCGSNFYGENFTILTPWQAEQIINVPANLRDFENTFANIIMSFNRILALHEPCHYTIYRPTLQCSYLTSSRTKNSIGRQHRPAWKYIF